METRKSSENLKRDTNHAAVIAIASLYILAIARIATEFVDQSYNWDVDTYIYYGQQLQRGEPIWITEVMAGLVVRDLLFAIPSLFGPLLTWRLISLGSAALAVICVILLLPTFLKKTGYPHQDSQRAATLSGGLYLLVSGHLPGGFTHINVLPTSLAIVALLLGFSLIGERQNRLTVFGSVILAGFAAAISISVRPYFIFPLAMGFVVLGFVIFAEKRLSMKQRIGRVSALLFAPTLIGLGLNLGPYLILGNVGQFFSQLNFLIQAPPAGTNSIVDVFVNVDFGINPGIRLWLVGMLLWSTLEIGAAMRRGSAGLIAALIPFSALMTAGGILAVYFLDHYANFFSWYFSIILATRLILVDRAVIGRFRRRLRPLLAPSVVAPIALSTVAALVLLFGVGPTATAPSVARVAQEHPDLALALALETKFASGPSPRPAFFVPQSHYAHWALEEARHGFPNAHLINRILRGTWEDLPPGSYTFRTPRNADEYCAEILESSIEVVVLEDIDTIAPCLAAAQPQWFYEQVVVSGGEAWGLWRRP